MNTQHELEPLVREWLHQTLDPIPEPTHRYGLVAAEVNETEQQRFWRPVPLPAGFTMWSMAKSFVAIGIVALFGGFLLATILTGPQSDEAAPATAVASPSPVANGERAFPTGTFVAEDGGPALEFRTDGTCQREDVRCTYGVNGRLFSEMSFEEPSGAQVPATYYWDFDGEQLTFEPWGVDKRQDRGSVYSDHVYRPVGETLPLPAADTDFPIGRFVPADGSGAPNVTFRDGAYSSSTGGMNSKYVVNRNLFTEMTFVEQGNEKVPATYYWLWDGERLSFRLWGEDDNRWRTALLLGRVYVRDDTQPSLSGRRLLLSHPQLEVWVTVEVVERADGRHEASATVDGEPLGEGVGDTLQEAVRAALEPLGEPYASEIAESVKG